MEAGKYNAKIKSYGLVTSPKGSPQVQVEFGIENGGNFSWFGNLGTPGQQEFTTKCLLTMGANASNIDKVENGIASGVLNVEKIYQIVIEDREYKGKVFKQIKYINDLSAPRGIAKTYITGTGALNVLKGQAAQLSAIDGAGMPNGKIAQPGF